ncbi:MAG: hypothetical protein KGL93_11970 [Gemmatimonadota bacterium]|nr:hypothetical protein [Gemmatimonadota bacterium]
MLGACATSAAVSTGGGAAAPASNMLVGQSSGTGRGDCSPEKIDAAFAKVGPVYRRCEVDRPALAIDTTFDTQGFVTPAQSCVSAVIDFVIGTNGLPLRQPVKVVETNSLDFARVLTHSISRWRYQPALRDGKPVQEIVRLQAAAQIGSMAGPPANPNSYANIGPSTC